MTDIVMMNDMHFQIERLKAKVEMYSWTTDQDGSIVSMLDAQAKVLLKKLKYEKDEELEPVKRELNVLKEKYKPLEDALKFVLDATEKCAQLWYNSQQQKIKETQEYAKMAEVEYGISIFTQETPGKISSTHGTSSVKDKVVFEVTDKAKIPLDYLMVDEKAIKQAISLGIREIPGVEIRTEKKITLRKKG